MRGLAFISVLMTIVAVCPAHADAPRLTWPLRPPPAVIGEFDAPHPDWQRGHRGIDLAGTAGQSVYAAGAATVIFAGRLADRPLVSIQHPGGLRTTYEPIEPSVVPGQQVDASTMLGSLQPGHPGCPVVCLHWGAMWGPAARADYLDPIGLLTSTPIRLKPLAGLN
jgi:murein DD-endopeptidase MepM/ murein hydrolase activator NlpD